MCEIIIYFILSTYLSDKDARKRFLEKQKLNEEMQIFKEMLDQTTDGILIYGLNAELMYRNWEKKKYRWWKEEHTIEENFKTIKVENKKNIETLTTQRICETKAASENEESDLWDLLSRTADNLNAQSKNNSSDMQELSAPFYITGKFEYELGEDESREFRRRTSLKEKRCECVLEIRVMSLMFRDKPALALIFHDITERSKIGLLEDNNNNYKNRLLASVSHELRTPLNASINFLQAAIDDPEVTENIKENFLQPSLASNRLLMFLINDILDFSQMAENKLRLVYEKADVKNTIEECLNLIKLQAKRKELSLEVDYDIETPSSQICTDHNRLKQIILNLLSNALKFTLEGSIKVKVQLLNSLEYNKILHVEVSDTGIGISEENQEKLFHAFEKIDLGARISLNSTGVGLGLVISNNLIQMLGSPDAGNSIKVSSQVGLGSTFSFSIMDKEQINIASTKSQDQSANYNSLMNELPGDLDPLPNDDPKLISPGPFRKTPNSIGTLKKGSSTSNKISELKITKKCGCSSILIVDDDDDVFNITALKLILDKIGFTSDATYNGEQAIKKISQRQGNYSSTCSTMCQQYRLIFMDCSMPILDGFKATKRLKAMMKNGEISPIPIVGCTAFVQVQEKQRALESGMDECITKPIDCRKITSVIKEYYTFN